ncbi:MAG: F0F1 ATP synthase subunit B [Ruminiclostridium sp.]|nr:F0F1 ATP synthase subunit B [Ruminiclostridium sp.]
MIEMLKLAEEAAATQGEFSLVSIDPNTIVFTLINTLIIFLIYFLFLHKPVCKILDERAAAVNKDMDDAQKAKEEADAVKAEYEQRLQQSKDEASRIVAEATKKAQQRETEIIASANDEAAQLKKRAEESIEKEKKKAINEIKEEISEMVVMAASKVAEKEISEKDNEKIIDTVLSQIGEND